jgi:hypothetical protein
VFPGALEHLENHPFHLDPEFPEDLEHLGYLNLECLVVLEFPEDLEHLGDLVHLVQYQLIPEHLEC